MIYICKDCCEPSNEIGPYDNCVNCGSHRIVEVNGFMYEGEIVIECDRQFEVAKFEHELQNEIDEGMSAEADRDVILFRDYMDEMLYQKTMEA